MTPAQLLDLAQDALEADEDGAGFCLACGEQYDGYAEPDARKYECASCGEWKVYGAAEILFMGGRE